MTRLFKYKSFRFKIEDDGLSLSDIKKSAADIFPELNDYVFMEQQADRPGAPSTIVAIQKQSVLQNQLDIEFNNRLDEVIEQAADDAERRMSARRITPGTMTAPRLVLHHSYGHSPGSQSDKRQLHPYYDSTMSDEELERWNKIKSLESLFQKPESEYTLTIGGQYAERGGYTHLIGKKAKSLLHDETVGVYIVQPEDEDKEYAIREIDIIL